MTQTGAEYDHNAEITALLHRHNLETAYGHNLVGNTCSVILPRLAPEAIERFILDQFDQAGLGHNTFTQDAMALVVRSCEGLLRRARNLCISALIEAVRSQTRTVELSHVNRVLVQPHWRKDYDSPAP